MQTSTHVLEWPMYSNNNSVYNQDLLMEAIDNYDMYTLSEKIVLKTLIELAIKDVVIISVLKLSQMTKVSRPIVYKALELFEENKLIKRIKKPKSKVSHFNINSIMFDDIIKNYVLQQNIINRIKK